MTDVLGLDPGPTESALVWWNGRSVVDKRIMPNRALNEWFWKGPDAILVIEKVESFGMAVGADVFETVFWSGRFAQTWEHMTREDAKRIGRRDIKLHLCGSVRAKDSNIRQALIDKFGGTAAIGTKASPGPLYGLKSHLFAALAVAVTWSELHG